MRETFSDIISEIIKAEGGFVNNASDRGGKTNMGISKASYPYADIRNLTRQEAIAKYERDYWNPSKAEKLPGHVRHFYFDMVVNHGQLIAVRILQRGLNLAGAELAVDGLIGPLTMKAASDYNRIDHLVAERLLFFASIVTRDNSQRVFMTGWMNRCIKFLN